MNAAELTYLIPVTFSSLLSLLMALFAWQHRRVPGARMFAVFAASEFIWTAGYIFELGYDDLQSKLLWDDVQFVGFVLAPIALLLFATDFVGDPLSVTRRRVLVAVAFVLIVFSVTDRWHGLLRENIVLEPTEPFGTLYYDIALAMGILSLVLYGITLVAIAILLQRYLAMSGMFRRQTAIIIIAVILPVIGQFVGWIGLDIAGQRDITPIFFGLSNTLIALALFRYNLFDILPVARNVVVENMQDAVIVIDGMNRVVDANPAAKHLLHLKTGVPVEASFAAWNDLFQAPTNMVQDRFQVFLQGHYYDCLITPVLDRHQAVAGRTLVVHDVTEAVNARREAELMYQIGRKINASTDYVGILQSVVDAMGKQDFGITLTLYENFDLSQATYIEAVALVPPYRSQARPFLRRASIENLPEPFLSQMRPGLHENLVVVEDITQSSTAVRQFFSGYNVAAAAVAGIVVENRAIGALNFYAETARNFTPFERRILVGVADLAAAAVERTRLSQAREALVEQLHRLDNVKSQFLASMSHELRTPLNAVLNFTELTAKGYLGEVNERQADALTKAVSSGRHLLSLINDVLDISKIEAGELKLVIDADIRPEAELAAVVASIEGLIKDQPVSVICDIDEGLPALSGDRRRIRQIFFNLLSNAAKFTEQGTITVSAKHRDNEILFLVSDTGPGIASEDHALIFEPFQQTDRGIIHTGGTGLGLPITKRLVDAHGGRIWLESEPGEGSSFFVALPVETSEDRHV